MTGRVAIRPGEFPLVMLAIVGTIYCCVPETDQLDEVASVLVLVLVTELLASRFLWWLALPQTVLVLWSARAASSVEVAGELATARGCSALVVPVLLDSTALPAGLAGVQGVDWR